MPTDEGGPGTLVCTARLGRGSRRGQPSLTMDDEPLTLGLTGQAEGLLQLHLRGHSAGVACAGKSHG